MRYLITGGAGFIGSHLASRLLSDGNSVTVIDPKINSYVPGIEYINKNILEIENLSEIVSNHDYVFHLGALVGMKNGFKFPFESMENNLNATIAIMNSCIETVTSMFFASTSEIYGTNTNVPLTEDADRVVGPTWSNRWGYSESKAIAERILILNHRKHSLDVKIGRFFNVAGPGQSGEYGMVMPRFVEAAISNNPIIVYGTGLQTRSFCHINDTIDGILKVALDGRSGEVYNIGNPEEISINDLASLIVTQLKSSSEISHAPYDSVYPGYVEIERRVPDVSKLKALGWVPKYSLKDIINDIAESK